MPAPPTGLLRTILPGVVRDPIGSLSLLGTSISVRLLGRLTSAVPPGLYSRDATMEDRRRAAAFRADESWSVLAAILLGSRERVCPSTAPTLVVAGSQDLITPTTIVRTLADSLHATLVEVDVAHAFNEEPSFTRVTDVVLEHLSDAEG
jgi:pimeloyl-ACP methyl ester carboxylesterase